MVEYELMLDPAEKRIAEHQRPLVMRGQRNALHRAGVVRLR